ncbi:MAG: LysR family transcriptional regulator [Glaciihabitans sp.]|nr:LysR family transcriptional regulator [Glaciihabitans sp.]
MEIEDLRRFIAVAELATLSEAAGSLTISQPTLSRTLARIEVELGTQLFDRIGRNIRINEQGQLFELHARRIVAEMDEAVGRMNEIHNEDRGQIRLGYLNSLSTWLVPPMLREFRRGHPNVSFVLRQDRPHLLEDALRDHTLDLALISPRPEDERLLWTSLHSERFYLTVPSDHPLATRKSLYLAEASEEDFVMQYSASSIRIILDRIAVQSGIKLKVTFRSDAITALRGLVVAGIGLSITSIPEHQSIIFQEEGLVDIPLLDKEARREVGIVWRDTFPLSAAATAFRRHAREFSAERVASGVARR